MNTDSTSAKKQDSFFVFDNFLGDSDWARRTRRKVLQTSSHRFHAFITGPEGSGKRLIARALHEHGSRSHKPFIPVDCGSLPGMLFRSQLFGQSFSETTTLGCFRSADGGTIYLSNIERLDGESQIELLEAIESSTVVPLDSTDAHKVDVRVIVGSEMNLEDEVRQGRLRSDLYRRLCVLSFETTSLRSRPADIIPIANHFAAKHTFERGLDIRSFTNAAMDSLMSYHWPGNVRELHDVIDVAVGELGTHESKIEADVLPISDENRGTANWSTLAELEVKHIRETLIHTRGSVGQAADMLGIDRLELERRLVRLAT